MLFTKKIPTLRFYYTNKVISIIKQVQITNKTDFVIVVLNVKSKIFIVYMVI